MVLANIQEPYKIARRLFLWHNSANAMRLDSATSGNAVHATLGPGRFHAVELSNVPDDQVARTLRIMSQRASADAVSPEFRQHAAEVFEGVAPFSVLPHAFDHTKRSILFQRDENIGLGFDGGSPDDLVEVIIRPVDMARYIEQGIATGDCDDFAMYLAALLMTQGIPCKFCTVAASELAPDQYSHVYVVAYPNGERVPMDASHGEYPGWEVPNKYGKLKEWSADGSPSLLSLAALAGLGWLGWKAWEAYG